MDESTVGRRKRSLDSDQVANRGAKRLFMADVSKRVCLILHDRIMGSERDLKRSTLAQSERGSDVGASSSKAEERPAKQPRIASQVSREVTGLDLLEAAQAVESAPPPPPRAPREGPSCKQIPARRKTRGQGQGWTRSAVKQHTQGGQ